MQTYAGGLHLNFNSKLICARVGPLRGVEVPFRRTFFTLQFQSWGCWGALRLPWCQHVQTKIRYGKPWFSWEIMYVPTKIGLVFHIQHIYVILCHLFFWVTGDKQWPGCARRTFCFWSRDQALQHFTRPSASNFSNLSHAKVSDGEIINSTDSIFSS